MAGKKSATPLRYVVKYEFDGSPHYGAIQINNGDRLHLETPHGSKVASLKPKSDVDALTMPAHGVGSEARFDQSSFELTLTYLASSVCCGSEADVIPSHDRPHGDHIRWNSNESAVLRLKFAVG